MAMMVATTGTEVMTNGSSRVYRGDKGLSYLVVVLGAGQRDVGCHPATTHTASRNSLLLAARTTGGQLVLMVMARGGDRRQVVRAKTGGNYLCGWSENTAVGGCIQLTARRKALSRQG